MENSAPMMAFNGSPETPEQKEARELRNKEWDDLTDTQKIERMREIVKSNNQWHARQIRILEKKVNKLSKHDHADGKVMVEYNAYDLESDNCVGEVMGVKNFF